MKCPCAIPVINVNLTRHVMCRRQLSASQTSLLQAARRLGTAGGPPPQMTGGPLRSSSSRRCQPCLSRPPSPMTHGAPQPAASCSSSSRIPAHRYYHDSTYIKTCRTYVISNLKYLSMFKGSCVSDAGGVFCHVFSRACLVLSYDMDMSVQGTTMVKKHPQ